MKKKPNLFLRILSDSWSLFKQKNPAYSNEYYDEVIEKVVSCGDIEKGYIKYLCTYCGEHEKTIGFTCKHSFCLKCGSIKALKFVEEVKAKLLPDLTYRHLTLTMPELLWPVFYKNRHYNDLWNRFYKAAWDFIVEIFQVVTKKKKVLPGAVMVIHVTGRKSSYNVHLHILIPMGVLDQISEKWIDISTLPFNLLHFRWKKILLNMLEKFDPSVEMKSLIMKIRKKYKKGFVANLDMRIVPKGGGKLAKYLAKYLFRPSISVKRIINYDKAKAIIDYEYNCHESGKLEREKVSTMKFVGRMVQQIMPKGFQRVRYYGIHGTAKGVKGKEQVIKGLPGRREIEGNKDEKVALNRARQLSFREVIMEWKNIDPLICKSCGRLMELVEVWIEGKGTVFSLFEKLANGPPDFLFKSTESKSESKKIEADFSQLAMDF